MPIVISPKTTREIINSFSEVFNLHKISKSDGRFWHGNFNDNFYEGLDGGMNALFTGYSGGVVIQAILEYATQYNPNEIYFVGSVYAYRDSDLEPGDIIYVEDSFSPDSPEEIIYQNAKAKGITNVNQPNPVLLDKVLRNAKRKNIDFKPGRVYCRISPGYFPKFTRPTELMDEGMWFKESLKQIEENGWNCGEYESAAVLATSRLLDIPAVSLLDVKDKRYSTEKYVVATQEQKKRALYSILNVIKDSALLPNGVDMINEFNDLYIKYAVFA